MTFLIQTKVSKYIDLFNFIISMLLINISTFWHVGCYALISGIVGYKTCKYSNLFY